MEPTCGCRHLHAQRDRVNSRIKDRSISLAVSQVKSTPRLNGKVERSHRIDDEEFYRLLAGEVIDDAKHFNTKLHEWERFYNFARPHGALGGQTPYERLRQLTRPSV
jgi:transposase InsO family protein